MSIKSSKGKVRYVKGIDQNSAKVFKEILRRTERGFLKFAEFDTQWHSEVQVQESSMAFEGPCVWIFGDLSYSNTPKKNPPAFHLNYEDAIALRDALSKFIDLAQQERTCEPPPKTKKGKS